MKKRIAAIMAIAGFMCGCWQTSTGERVGIVTKFSQKGAVCNTWEGELHFASNTGMLAPDPWTFSVDEGQKHGENKQQLVDQLNQAALTGKRVKLGYVQEMISGPCRSDTDYFVTSVIVLE